MKALPFAIAIASGCIVGCTAPKMGTIGASGFEQPLFEYRVGYVDAAHASFFGPDWKLDNYVQNGGFWAQKKGSQYEALRELDENEDGTIAPNERNAEPIYDLKFVNVHDNGVIWFK